MTPMRWFFILSSSLLTACQFFAVDNARSQFDFEKIQWFADRAKLAYADDASIQKALPNVRGTNNLKNALLDASYLQSADNKLGIYAHKGFMESTDKVYADLQGHLQRDYTTYVTGHSLGAAIATMLMMHLQVDGYLLARSYNFGQPKVSNGKGVKRYARLPVVRIVNKEDPVPLVPPLTLLDSVHGRYEHLGAEVILLRREFYSYLDEHDAERLSVGSFWKNIGHEKLTDHFMDSYIKNVGSKITASRQIAYDQREHFLGQ